jgi:hypothetical protein
MAEEDKMYKLICSERFDKIDALQQATIDILRGSNGNPGLLDDVRAMKKAHKQVTAAVIFVVGAVSLQAIHVGWVWIAGFF